MINMHKELQEKMVIMSEQMENLSREMFRI